MARRRKKSTKKVNTNSLSTNELCEIPDFLKRDKKSTPKRKRTYISPQKRWAEAQKRAHEIAESCREINVRTREETNKRQNAEYHRLKDYYDLVNDHMFTKEAKDNRVSGKVTAEEKRRYNIYIKCGVKPEDMALEILRWRLLENG